MLITVTFLDGQFGFLPDAPRASVSIGGATSGTLNQLTPITDKTTLLGTFTGGPLVEDRAFQLANGTGTAYAMRCATTVAGVVSSITPTLQAGSDGALTVTGSPADGFKSIIVQITTAGKIALANAQAIASFDGGINFSPPFTIPVGGVYSPADPVSGLTLNFTNGAVGFKVGDRFTFSCTGPTPNSTDLVNAMDALRGDATSDWEFFRIIGPSSSAIFAAVISEINLMRLDGRFVWAMLEARDQTAGESELDWMTAIRSDFANSVALQGQIVIAAGYGYLTSAVSGRVFWRPLATPMAARVTNAADYAEHLGATAGGPLSGLVPGPDGVTIVSHDERKVPGLAAARFLTAASVIGQKGYFIGDNGKLEPATFAQLLSDFRKLMYVRVAMRTANLAVVIGSKLLGAKIETNRNGTINDRFAKEIEQVWRAELKNQLVPADLQDIDVQINRATNIKVTGNVPTKLVMNSWAYAEEVDFTLAFLNPNLVVVS